MFVFINQWEAVSKMTNLRWANLMPHRQHLTVIIKIYLERNIATCMSCVPVTSGWCQTIVGYPVASSPGRGKAWPGPSWVPGSGYLGCLLATFYAVNRERGGGSKAVGSHLKFQSSPPSTSLAGAGRGATGFIVRYIHHPILPSFIQLNVMKYFLFWQ